MNLLAFMRRRNDRVRREQRRRCGPDVELVEGLQREAAPFGPQAARPAVTQAIADGHRAAPTTFTRKLHAINGGR